MIKELFKKKITLILQVIKYFLVGISNTLITLVIIYILWELVGINQYLSNMIGYVVGVINSFLLNKLWTFKSKNSFVFESLKFLLVFLVMYAIQFSLVYLLNNYTLIPDKINHIIGMVLYTVLGFVLNKILVFRR